MQLHVEQQFRRLLAQHDPGFLRFIPATTERGLRLPDFDRRFHEYVHDVIEPILAQLRALMHDHGLHSKIIVTERRIEPDGKLTPSSIAFEFHVLTDPEAHGFPVTTPTLAFIADPSSQNVVIHENSILPFVGGHIGAIDQCTLENLTGERVEKYLLAIAQRVLRGPGPNGTGERGLLRVRGK